MKPLFVMVGGWATDQTIWRLLAQSLAAHGEVQYVDWRDLIKEDPPRLNLGVPLGTERLEIGIGWSLGAMLLLEGAMARPEALDRLVLISPTASMTGVDDWPGTPTAVLRAMQLRFDLKPEQVLREFFELCFSPEAPGDQMEPLVEIALRAGDDSLKRGLQWLARADLRERLYEMKTPSLVLHGTEDAVIPFEAGRTLAERLPHAQLQILQGRGHALPLTDAGAIFESIEAWLNAKHIA